MKQTFFFNPDDSIISFFNPLKTKQVLWSSVPQQNIAVVQQCSEESSSFMLSSSVALLPPSSVFAIVFFDPLFTVSMSWKGWNKTLLFLCRETCCEERNQVWLF